MATARFFRHLNVVRCSESLHSAASVIRRRSSRKAAVPSQKATLQSVLPQPQPLCSTIVFGTACIHSKNSPPPSRQYATLCNSYSNPEAYDIAFSYRDFPSEVAFLLQAYATHSSTIDDATGTSSSSIPPLSNFLELGCGPARHSILLSESGGGKITCVGLDVSPDMVKYASAKVVQAGQTASVSIVQGDMTSPHGILSVTSNYSKAFDVAVILLGTLSHCLDNESALRCFKNIGEVVRPGGLLILELAHPNELFGGSFVGEAADFVDCWEVSEDGLAEFADDEEEEEKKEDQNDDNDNDDNKMKRVLVEYGREGDVFDSTTQIFHRTVGLSLFDEDGNLVSSDVSVVPQRQFTLQEIDLLARLSGHWSIVGVYGDLLDSMVGVEDEAAYRLVVVLRNGGGK